jgi:hypothetical protein
MPSQKPNEALQPGWHDVPESFGIARQRVVRAGQYLGPVSNLSQQSLRDRPRVKRSCGETRAGVVGYLFEAAHKASAPMWQSGTYIRSRELYQNRHRIPIVQDA